MAKSVRKISSTIFIILAFAYVLSPDSIDKDDSNQMLAQYKDKE